MNYFEAAFLIQTKIGAQQNFKHLIHVHFSFHSREPLKKNMQVTKDHIPIIFDPLCGFLTLFEHFFSDF